MLSFVTSLTTSKVANDIIMSMRYLDDLATPLPRGIFLTLRIWQRWHNNMDERTYIFFFFLSSLTSSCKFYSWLSSIKPMIMEHWIKQITHLLDFYWMSEHMKANELKWPRINLVTENGRKKLIRIMRFHHN